MKPRDKNGKWTNGLPNYIGDKIQSNDQEEFLVGLNTDVDQLMNKAQEAGPEVEQRAQEAANVIGGTVTPVNYKSRESIIRKSRDEYGNDVSQVKDAVRTTIIVNKQEDIPVVLKQFEQPGNRVKIQKPENFLGYSGAIVNFRAKNGLHCEIQVNTPEMIYAKVGGAEKMIGSQRFNEIKKKVGLPNGKGHTYYEDFRSIDKTKPENLPIIDEIKRLSNDYYNRFR